MTMSGVPRKELFSLEDISVSFSGEAGVLHDVSLSVAEGETLGLVGESGSGKSVSMMAAAGLLDRSARITGGQAVFDGQVLTELPARALRRLRGAAISMVFQNPRAALNPILSIGEQIGDVIAAHEGGSKRQIRARVQDLLKELQFPAPERQARAFAHELSGGLCQRAVIAIALACGPRLLIADEPTTGLDPVTQKSVMDLLSRLIAARGMSLILITHDMGLAASFCDRIAVMEAGQIVETGPVAEVLAQPSHPCTRRLVRATPGRDSRVEDLLPDAPPLPAVPAVVRMAPPLLQVEGLTKHFAGVAAVQGISFHLDRGESLGIVGESGSGKSTTARMVARLMDPDAGVVKLNGVDLTAMPERGFHRSDTRPRIQMVFQDAGGGLNPRWSAAQSIADPLRMLRGLSGAELQARVAEAARQAGLAPELLWRRPHQLSEGQKARVGIARAIAPRPDVLILDEPTASLDVPVQAAVLHLLERLRRQNGMACLFISHDLNVVRMMCDRVLVMRQGQVVEEGASERLFADPRTAYTRCLIEAVPQIGL